MKYTEQELAAKMKKRLANERDRQRRWRLRQKEKGLKPIAGMVSDEALTILKDQKKKTGETISKLLEKAILKLSMPNPSAEEEFDSIHSPAPDNVQESEKDATKYKEEIFDKIKKMRHENNLPFNEIAKIFNEEGLRTLSAENSWDGKSIYTIYKNIEKR